MNQIQIFNNPEFGSIRTVEINNEPWFVGKDVAVALGYSNPRKALADHVRDNHKLDGVTIRDSIGREQNPIVIDEAGLYSLVMRSKTEKAEAFQEWVTAEVLPAIRKTGSYALPNKADEIRLRRLDIMQQNANIKQQIADIKAAKMLMAVGKASGLEIYNQICLAKAAEKLCGEPVLPLPQVEKSYSADDIGKMLNISANMVGRIANHHGLKTERYGSWCGDITKSGKQVPVFRYNDAGLAELERIVKEELV